jgi:hypothetical protein
VTISGELIGRWGDTGGDIVTSVATHPRLAGVRTSRLLSDSSLTNLLSVVPGMKWNLGDTWVVIANLTVPLTRAGLTSPVTPFVGLDYTF